MSTLYEKVGRRYLPVHDTVGCDGLADGTWVVDIKDGRRFATRAVDPGPTLEQLAAMPALAELIAAELVERSRSEPSSRPTTPKEKKAWAAYCAVMGPDATLSLTRPSAYDVAGRVAGRLVAMAGGATAPGDADAGPAGPARSPRRRQVS